MFNKKQTMLFNQGYGAYRKIVEFCLENRHILDQEEKDGSDCAIIMLSDLQLQKLLANLSITKYGKMNELEQTYLTSIIETSEVLKGAIKGYAKFFRNMTLQNFEDINFNMKDEADDIPVSIAIAAQVNAKSASEVFQNWKTIFNSYIGISEDEAEEKNSAAMRKIDEFQQFFAKNGIRFDDTSSGKCVVDKENGSRDGTKELESLIGLGSIKHDVLETLNLLKVNEMKKKAGLSSLNFSKHMVFTGNPGTGKTTVARIIAKIYQENGIVSNGQLIETDRSGLVDNVIGGTALKTRQVVESAIGGVLFIDEAYTLAPEDSTRDFGQEAIGTLVKIMEDEKDDLVVIVAGYKNEMKRFIEANPGLKSRFRKYFEFQDYSASEMSEIFDRMAKENGYIITSDAEKRISDIWNEQQKNTMFGNGRGVKNVFEQILAKQATRIVEISDPDKETLMTILAEDVPDIESNLFDTVEQKNPIGFRL